MKTKGIHEVAVTGLLLVFPCPADAKEPVIIFHAGSLMLLQLAEKYYNQPGPYERLIANRPQSNVRLKSVELVSLLKTGKMDYL